MGNTQESNQSRLFQYIHGYRQTQLIYIAAELKIADFLKAVKTGKSPFQKVFGMDLFEYYETHPSSGLYGVKPRTRRRLQVGGDTERSA